MMEFHSTDDILVFAIQGEQDAADFYEHLSSKMPHDRLKNVCRQFAREELQHRAKLETMRKTLAHTAIESPSAIVKSLAEMVDLSALAELTYEESLRIAMKAEKATYKMYVELAEYAADHSQRDLFLQLAQEEANHKLRFELEYDAQHPKEA